MVALNPPGMCEEKNMTLQRPSKRGPKFDAMMAEIDLKLTNEGIDIPSRPISAVREVSPRYGLSMPLGGGPSRLPPELRENASRSEAINQRYMITYGDRLPVNPCRGRMVTLLHGDHYIPRVPRAFAASPSP